MMHDHVRSIHQAVTGHDPPERETLPGPAPSWETVMQRFAELEAMTRTNPFITERVPPYSFAPPLDVIGTEREILLELALPGVDEDDVEVDVVDGQVVVSGARSTAQALDGRVYFHTEMARGPFRRVVLLPGAVSGLPRVEIDRGVVRIRLARASKASLPQA